jgi:hypothetical protein
MLLERATDLVGLLDDEIFVPCLCRARGLWVCGSCHLFEDRQSLRAIIPKCLLVAGDFRSHKRTSVRDLSSVH